MIFPAQQGSAARLGGCNQQDNDQGQGQAGAQRTSSYDYYLLSGYTDNSISAIRESPPEPALSRCNTSHISGRTFSTPKHMKNSLLCQMKLCSGAFTSCKGINAYIQRGLTRGLPGRKWILPMGSSDLRREKRSTRRAESGLFDRRKKGCGRSPFTRFFLRMA